MKHYNKCLAGRILFCALALSAASLATPDRSASAQEQMTAEQYYARASKENMDGKYEDAIADFDRAIAKNPQYWKAFANRSAARFNTKNYAGALDDINLAIAHMGQLKGLVELKQRIVQTTADNSNQAERLRMARQMLLNAQLGGDFTDPAANIMRMANQVRAAQAAQALMAPRRAEPAAGQSGTISHGPSPFAAGSGSTENSPFAEGSASHSDATTSTSHASATSHAASSSKTSAAGHAGNTSSKLASQTSTTSNKLASSNSDSPFQVSDSPSPPPSNGSSNWSTSSQPSQASEPAASTYSTGLMHSGSSLVSPLNSQATANQPASPSGMSAQAYFDRACGKGQAMDLLGAIKDYDEAIKLDPNFGKAYANRGSARFNYGDRKGALDDFNKAVELMPENPGVKELRDRVAAAVGP